MPYGKSSASSGKRKRRKRRATKKSSTRSTRSRKRSGSRTTRRQGASTRTSSSSRRAVRLYTRYDPDSGISARVANTDPRYDEWLTAAQWRSATKAKIKAREKRVEAGIKIAEGVAPALLPAGKSAVAAAQNAAAAARRTVARVAATRVAVGAGTATVGISAAAGLAILAGVASYYGTTWLIERVHKLTDPQERAATMATAYRTARREAAKRLGRELTPEENRYLGAELQAQIAKMGGRVQ